MYHKKLIRRLGLLHWSLLGGPSTGKLGSGLAHGVFRDLS